MIAANSSSMSGTKVSFNPYSVSSSTATSFHSASGSPPGINNLTKTLLGCAYPSGRRQVAGRFRQRGRFGWKRHHHIWKLDGETLVCFDRKQAGAVKRATQLKDISAAETTTTSGHLELLKRTGSILALKADTYHDAVAWVSQINDAVNQKRALSWIDEYDLSPVPERPAKIREYLNSCFAGVAAAGAGLGALQEDDLADAEIIHLDPMSRLSIGGQNDETDAAVGNGGSAGGRGGGGGGGGGGSTAGRNFRLPVTGPIRELMEELDAIAYDCREGQLPGMPHRVDILEVHYRLYDERIRAEIVKLATRRPSSAYGAKATKGSSVAYASEPQAVAEIQDAMEKCQLGSEAILELLTLLGDYAALIDNIAPIVGPAPTAAAAAAADQRRRGQISVGESEMSGLAGARPESSFAEKSVHLTLGGPGCPIMNGLINAYVGRVRPVLTATCDELVEGVAQAPVEEDHQGHLFTHSAGDLYHLIFTTHLALAQEATCRRLEEALLRSGLEQLVRFHEAVTEVLERSLRQSESAGVLKRMAAACNDLDDIALRLDDLVESMAPDLAEALEEDLERVRQILAQAGEAAVSVLIDLVIGDMAKEFSRLFREDWREGNGGSIKIICATLEDYLNDLCPRLTETQKYLFLRCCYDRVVVAYVKSLTRAHERRLAKALHQRLVIPPRCGAYVTRDDEKVFAVFAKHISRQPERLFRRQRAVFGNLRDFIELPLDRLMYGAVEPMIAMQGPGLAGLADGIESVVEAFLDVRKERGTAEWRQLQARCKQRFAELRRFEKQVRGRSATYVRVFTTADDDRSSRSTKLGARHKNGGGVWSKRSRTTSLEEFLQQARASAQAFSDRVRIRGSDGLAALGCVKDPKGSADSGSQLKVRSTADSSTAREDSAGKNESRNNVSDGHGRGAGASISGFSALTRCCVTRNDGDSFTQRQGPGTGGSSSSSSSSSSSFHASPLRSQKCLISAKGSGETPKALRAPSEEKWSGLQDSSSGGTLMSDASGDSWHQGSVEEKCRRRSSSNEAKLMSSRQSGGGRRRSLSDSRVSSLDNLRRAVANAEHNRYAADSMRPDRLRRIHRQTSRHDRARGGRGRGGGLWNSVRGWFGGCAADK